MVEYFHKNKVFYEYFRKIAASQTFAKALDTPLLFIFLRLDLKDISGSNDLETW